jgi:hypothetical protein
MNALEVVGRAATDPEFASRLFGDTEAFLASPDLALDAPGRAFVMQWIVAGSLPAQQARLASANLDQALFAMERARKLQTDTLELFTDTLKRAKGTFGRVTLMNQTLFAIGVGVFVVAAIWGLISKEKITVAFGGLGGLAAFAATFFKGPIDRMQAAFSNLVQGEAAFMNFYEQITIWDGYVFAGAGAPTGNQPGGPGLPGSTSVGPELEKRIEKASEVLQERTAQTMELLQRYIETRGEGRKRDEATE